MLREVHGIGVGPILDRVVLERVEEVSRRISGVGAGERTVCIQK